MLDGVPEAIFDNARQSPFRRIAIIFQEPPLFPDLTSPRTFFVGVQPLSVFSPIDRRRPPGSHFPAPRHLLRQQVAPRFILGRVSGKAVFS